MIDPTSARSLRLSRRCDGASCEACLSRSGGRARPPESGGSPVIAFHPLRENRPRARPPPGGEAPQDFVPSDDNATRPEGGIVAPSLPARKRLFSAREVRAISRPLNRDLGISRSGQRRALTPLQASGLLRGRHRLA